MVAAPDAAAAAVVAEVALQPPQWSCVPIKGHVFPRHLSFLAKSSKLFLKVMVQQLVVAELSVHSL